MTPLKFTRRNAVKSLRFDAGVKISFSDILWYEEGKFLRQRTAGNGNGERVQVTAREALQLIRHNYDR